MALKSSVVCFANMDLFPTLTHDYPDHEASGKIILITSYGLLKAMSL